MTALTPGQQAIEDLLAAIDQMSSELAAAKIHLAGLEDEQETRS